MADIENLDISIAGKRSDDSVRPCPFCGSENVVISPYDGKNIVICMNCFCRNSGNESKEKSIAAWNRRANDVYEGKNH